MKKFKQWMMSEKEAEVMKRALYFKNQDKAFKQFLPAHENELCCILKPFGLLLNWKECAGMEHTFVSLNKAFFNCLNKFLFLGCFLGIPLCLIIFDIIFVCSLLICLIASVLKLIIFPTSLCLTVPSSVQSLYTDYLLLPLLKMTIVVMYVQKAFSKLLGHFFLVNHLNSLSYCVPPLLPITVRAPINSLTTSTPITKTVNAFIDTGASKSCISATLAKELNLAEKPAEVIHYAGDVQVELVDIEVSGFQPDQNQNHEVVSAQFTPVRIERTLIDITSKTKYWHSSSQLTKIGRLVDVPVVTVADKDPNNFSPYDIQAGGLMIGADLIPSLLITTSASPRVIPITFNLNAVETRLGYYLQGSQCSALDFFFC